MNLKLVNANAVLKCCCFGKSFTETAIFHKSAAALIQEIDLNESVVGSAKIIYLSCFKCFEVSHCSQVPFTIA